MEVQSVEVTHSDITASVTVDGGQVRVLITNQGKAVDGIVLAKTAAAALLAALRIALTEVSNATVD